MNQLSWMLYLASVAGNFNSFFWLSLLFLIIVTIILSIRYFILLDELYDDAKKAFKPTFLKSVVPFYVVLSILFLVVPGRNTIYAIAASEMGERMMHTTVATKAEKALEAWLDQQIAEASKPAKKGE